MKIAEQIVPCTTCRYCVRGAYNMCMPHNIYGFRQIAQGAMCKYMKYISGSKIHKIPKNMTVNESIFIEPFSCAIHAINRADIGFNDIVVISGAGAIGCGAVVAAKQKNPKLLIVLDLFDWKLDIAKKCGADIVLNPTKINVIDTVKQITDGFGCDKFCLYFCKKKTKKRKNINK